MKRRLVVAIVIALVGTASVADAKILELYAQIQGGGATGRGMAGMQKDNDFFHGAQGVAAVSNRVRSAPVSRFPAAAVATVFWRSARRTFDAISGVSGFGSMGEFLGHVFRDAGTHARGVAAGNEEARAPVPNQRIEVVVRQAGPELFPFLGPGFRMDAWIPRVRLQIGERAPLQCHLGNLRVVHSGCAVSKCHFF